MRRLLAALPGLALFAAACGGGGNAAGPTAQAPSSSVKTVPVASAAADGGTCPSSAGLGPDVTPHGSAAVSGTKVSIQAADSFFAPTCLTGAPASFTLEVKSTGSALHNLSIPDQGIDVDIPARKTITVTVKSGAQPVQFFCKYHRTSGMVGAVVAN